MFGDYCQFDLDCGVGCNCNRNTGKCYWEQNEGLQSINKTGESDAKVGILNILEYLKTLKHYLKEKDMSCGVSCSSDYDCGYECYCNLHGRVCLWRKVNSRYLPMIILHIFSISCYYSDRERAELWRKL